MCSIFVVVLLPLIAHAQAEDSIDQLANKLVNSFVARILKAAPLDDADLDDTTLAGMTAAAPSSLRSVSHSPFPLVNRMSAHRSPFPIPYSELPVPRSPFQVSNSRIAQAFNVPRSVSASATKLPSKEVSVGLVGYGLVGKELVRQIESKPPALGLAGLTVNVVAVSRSREMYLGSGAPNNANAGNGGVPTDLSKLGEFMSTQPGRKVIVDCTADDAPPDFYAEWLSAGVDVVTPNKKLGSGPLARWEKTFDAARSTGTRFCYEASVGAGLPIITTLKDLLRTGDSVQKIEGIFSGTLSYLFNEGGGKDFSAVVADAADKGFTEPDPRDDLSGLDVQRKTVILARDCGLKVELDDVPVESLVPKPLQTWEPTEDEKKQGLSKVFIEKMKEYDGDMKKKMDEAEAAGEVLRYVGMVDVKNKKASVGLQRFPKNHPFAATQYADNIISYSTEWYTPRPLVVQGPGAGAAVTAGGVFADLIRAGRGSPPFDGQGGL